MNPPQSIWGTHPWMARFYAEASVVPCWILEWKLLWKLNLEPLNLLKFTPDGFEKNLIFNMDILWYVKFIQIAAFATGCLPNREVTRNCGKFASRGILPKPTSRYVFSGSRTFVKVLNFDPDPVVQLRNFPTSLRSIPDVSWFLISCWFNRFWWLNYNGLGGSKML